MALQYKAAIQILQSVAAEALSRKGEPKEEWVPLEEAVGRVTTQEIKSPEASPQFDTATADGFALRSSTTINASEQNPISYRVISGTGATDDEAQKKTECVKMTAGAWFPDSAEEESNPIDACASAEDVEEEDGGLSNGTLGMDERKTIRVTRPVQPNENRQAAGSDFGKGDQVVGSGMTIRPSHLIPLATIGVKDVAVEARISARVWSVDANNFSVDSERSVDDNGGEKDQRSEASTGGRYIVAALQQLGIDARQMGWLAKPNIESALRDNTRGQQDRLNVLVLTGPESQGITTSVRRVVQEKLGGLVHFHNRGSVSPLFALPGDPGSVAACFRFLVVPYIKHLRGEDPEEAVLAPLENRCSTIQGNRDARIPSERSVGNDCGPLCLDCFQHGKLKNGLVSLSKDQNPGRAAPFSDANCWVHLPQGQEVVAGATVPCYSISGTV
ncbi:MoeA, N-terminal and linker domain-containing protein [Apodospora peruviana]|uniref:MoeA, N-terminal and linker domain-containing protein n=1 Tax=Apodospora peruviana TaxID=516989 RepID=A0AAE0LZ05_9PEZI|nr:MoeA, N-terminal and linker domain-containing protein [Apodospora peruviana]